MHSSSQIEKMVATARAAFRTGRTGHVQFRLNQLKALLRMLEENARNIIQVLEEDLRKPRFEIKIWDFGMMKKDVQNMIGNVEEWAKTKYSHKTLLAIMDEIYVTNHPYGVVLILASSSFPFQLTQFCGAIAAGNCVIFQLDSCPKLTSILGELIPKYLDPQCYHVIPENSIESVELVKEKFDYISYTGQKNLGGQIHGQSALSPDYILCSKEVERNFIKESCKILNSWYGLDWKLSKDLGRILNKGEFKRLKPYLSNSGIVAIGGETDENELWIQPSILNEVKLTDPIMKTEILGPILPILTCDSPFQAIQLTNSICPNPLALYVFTNSGKIRSAFENQTSSGSLFVNDTVSPLAYDELPEGGIGDSGLGYIGHGKYSFDTFTHLRGTVKREYSWLGDQSGVFRYPPYKPYKIQALSFLLNHWKKFQLFYLDFLPHFLWFLIGIVVALWLL